MEITLPVTTLDPQTALIAIDLQKGVAGMFPAADALKDVVANTNRLARAFRARGWPVVLVVAAGRAPGRTDQPRRGPAQLPPGATDLVPELIQAEGDIHVVKHTPGAFAKTGLEDKLNALGVTQVVITGVATSGGVDSTARQAYELGFNVTLPTDAMRDGSSETHAETVSKVFPRIAEVGTTDDVLACLAGKAASVS
jgi:nicotinamidase-related amidase